MRSMDSTTLDAQPESVKQVAVADRLVLTKTDLAAAFRRDLVARLAALNPARAAARQRAWRDRSGTAV